MNFKFNWLELEPGDILLSRGEGLKSTIISKATNGHFSHAMLYVGRSIIHADGEGVYSKNPQRIYAKNATDLAVYRIKENLPKTDLEKICAAARSEVGKLYDLKGAMYSVISSKNQSNENRQFCSKLIAQAFSAASIDFGKSIDKITPNDFCRSDKLELKENLITTMSEREFEFAISPDYNLELQHETFDFLAKARDFAKENNRKIETISDVLSYLIDHPDDDKIFCKMIESTRYSGFVNIDKEKNPYRYDLQLFKNELMRMPASDQEEFLKREDSGLAEEIQHRLKNYLWSVLILAERDLAFFRAHHDLMKDLYLNTSTRAHVIALFFQYQGFLRTLPH